MQTRQSKDRTYNFADIDKTLWLRVQFVIHNKAIPVHFIMTSIINLLRLSVWIAAIHSLHHWLWRALPRTLLLGLASVLLPFGAYAGGAYGTKLVFAPDDDRPYLAYQDMSNGAKATVRRLNTARTGWEIVGRAGFSASEAPYISLAIGPDGRPYVAYQDRSQNNKATVMRLNAKGNDWEAVGGVGFTPGRADFTALAFAPNGTPYVAYGVPTDIDKEYFYHQAAVVRLNATGTGWESVGKPVIPCDGRLISLAFNQEGQPQILGNNGGYASFDGVSWGITSGSGAGAGSPSPLVAGPDGNLYYALVNEQWKIDVYQQSPLTNWQAVGNLSFTEYGVDIQSLDLAIDPSGRPYVVYSGFGSPRANVMRLNAAGTAWEKVLGEGWASEGAAYDTSLAFDSNGTLYLAYRDVDQGDKAMVKCLNMAKKRWDPVGRLHQTEWPVAADPSAKASPLRRPLPSAC